MPISSELSSDQTIRSHLAALYDTLLEQNLLRIVEPYNTVQVSYVAEVVGQGTAQVEAKWVNPFGHVVKQDSLALFHVDCHK